MVCLVEGRAKPAAGREQAVGGLRAEAVTLRFYLPCILLVLVPLLIGGGDSASVGLSRLRLQATGQGDRSGTGVVE